MKTHQIVLVGIACLLTVILRLVELPANFACMAALALFCGSVIRHPAAFLLPLAIRLLTDVLLHLKTGYGFYASWPFDYSAYILISLMGYQFVRPKQFGSVALGSIATVALFFVVSNFGVWMVLDMYPKTFTGLLDCYTMAVPFARGTIIGNLIAAPLFFFAWNAVTSHSAATESQCSAIQPAVSDE